MGLADTLSNDVTVGAAPADEGRAVAGISETAYELGAAMGIAVLGALGAGLYRSHVLTGLPARICCAASLARKSCNRFDGVSWTQD